MGIRTFFAAVLMIICSGDAWASHNGASPKRQLKDALLRLQLQFMGYKHSHQDFINIRDYTRPINKIIAQASLEDIDVINSELEDASNRWIAGEWFRRKCGGLITQAGNQFYSLFNTNWRGFHENVSLRKEALANMAQGREEKEGSHSKVNICEESNKEVKVDFERPIMERDDSPQEKEKQRDVAIDTYVTVMMRMGEMGGAIVHNYPDFDDDSNICNDRALALLQKSAYEELKLQRRQLWAAYRSDMRFFEGICKGLFIKNRVLKNVHDSKVQPLCSFASGFNFDGDILNIQEDIAYFTVNKEIKPLGLSTDDADGYNLNNWDQFIDTLERRQKLLKICNAIQEDPSDDQCDATLKQKKIALLQSINNACVQSLDSYTDAQLKNPSLVNSFVDDLICYYNRCNNKSKKAPADERIDWRNMREQMVEQLALVSDKARDCDGELSLDNCIKINEILQKPGSLCYQAIS